MRDLLTCAAFAACAAVATAQLPRPTTGDVLVSSSANDRLLRLAHDGTELAVLSYQGLSHPRGIVVGQDGTLFVVSQNTGEVLVLDRGLGLVRRFPTAGVSGPTGAAFAPNGNLFVAGFSSQNVGEFRLDGTPVRTYAAPQLGAANCVAFLPDGTFWVASASTGTVVQFQANGQVVRTATAFGLSSPMGIAIWQGEMYVAGGGSNNIAVFDLMGNPQRELRFPDLSGPQGIAVSSNGTFVSSSFYTNKCVFFRGDGTRLRTVLPASSRTPRSVAYLGGASIDAIGTPKLGQPFPFTVESEHDGAVPYVTGLALSTSPGLPLPGGRRFPLTPDPLFEISVSGAAAFQGFVGLLDGKGRGQPVLHLPVLPVLRGLTVHAAVITVDPASAVLFRQISSAVSWTL